MKKITFLICFVSFLSISNAALSYNLEAVSDITPVQRSQLTRIEHDFQYQNSEIEARIKNYTAKIEQVKNDTDKTEVQKSLLTSAYERNLETIKAQQKALEEKTDNLYKSVLSPEQYNQLKNRTDTVRY